MKQVRANKERVVCTDSSYRRWRKFPQTTGVVPFLQQWQADDFRPQRVGLQTTARHENETMFRDRFRRILKAEKEMQRW